jgi:glyoxalase family protein
MEHRITGIHHITAIAGEAKRNYDFYTRVLGLRFVKKTVNFDDPHTYHFYFGDEAGSPGTILTFFPWEGIVPGRRGTGIVTETGYSVPEGSLDFWLKRFEEHNITFNKPAEKFGETYLTFLDPDGLKLELIVPASPDTRKPWTTAEVDENVATRGFHTATLTLEKVDATARLLTEVFGYRLTSQQVNRYRFETDAVENASRIDLVEVPGERRGQGAGGTVHHIAFRVKNDAAQQHFQQTLLDRGLHVTPVMDRNYFHSVYFREPGGVLFEIATDNPGFTVDEPLNELGTTLKLPPQYEPERAGIEKVLPRLE